MTEQIPDFCRFDGREWFIEELEGTDWVIPTTEQLGSITGTELRLTSPTTANWSGRIDHYIVVDKLLYLFKVDVALLEDPELECSVDSLDSHLLPDKRIPSNYRIEEITRYEPYSSFFEESKSDVCKYWITRTKRILFEDLLIPFTGTICLLHPYFNPWEYPGIAEIDDIMPSHKAVLTFDRGRLVGQVTIILKKDDSLPAPLVDGEND